MTQIKRSIQAQIKKDLSEKMVIIAGPRQCGKTTLAHSLGMPYEYLNYDNLDDRAIILKREWDFQKKLIVFDELHKMPKWKAWLKGVYDKKPRANSILVTGSARLNAFKKTGDSLAGRHFYYRLHPFDMKELSQAKVKLTDQEKFNRLMTVGGYPEPFLKGDMRSYLRWRQTHLDLILRQDLADFEVVRDLRSIEVLVQMLRMRVGSCISVNALATDLQKDPKTVQKWLGILEDLFIIFKVTPYFKDISRAVKKESKYYFYDNGLVEGDQSVKLENLVACALLKEAHFQTDVLGNPMNLHFLKIKGGRELDFALIPEIKSEATKLIEVKWANSEISPNFKLFSPAFKNCHKIQLVAEPKRQFQSESGVLLTKASEWLLHM